MRGKKGKKQRGKEETESVKLGKGEKGRGNWGAHVSGKGVSPSVGCSCPQPVSGRQGQAALEGERGGKPKGSSQRVLGWNSRAQSGPLSSGIKMPSKQGQRRPPLPSLHTPMSAYSMTYPDCCG